MKGRSDLSQEAFLIIRTIRSVQSFRSPGQRPCEGEAARHEIVGDELHPLLKITDFALPIARSRHQRRQRHHPATGDRTSRLLLSSGTRFAISDRAVIEPSPSASPSPSPVLGIPPPSPRVGISGRPAPARSSDRDWIEAKPPIGLPEWAWSATGIRPRQSRHRAPILTGRLRVRVFQRHRRAHRHLGGLRQICAPARFQQPMRGPWGAAAGEETAASLSLGDHSAIGAPRNRVFP